MIVVYQPFTIAERIARTHCRVRPWTSTPISTFATTVCPPSGILARRTLGFVAPLYGAVFSTRSRHFLPSWRRS